MNAAPSARPGPRPGLSVVVPAYNEERLIGETLAHLRRALGAAGLDEAGFEIVVADNASSDATAALAARAGARVVHEPHRHIARARNAGAAAARGEWLLFVDADSWPSTELLGELRACIDAGDVVGGGATVRMRNLPAAAAVGLSVWNVVSRAGRLAAGAFVFCRGDAFRAVGGFSLDYYVAEEIEFSRRLKRWARPRGLRFRILHRHPLLTSERKLTLYGQREMGSILWRMLRHPRRFFRDPRLCYPWYDGRR